MRILSRNWPIFFLVFCSFLRSHHAASALSNSIEDYLKVTDEIISKSQSYDKFMKGIRENWQSPFVYLLRRGYIPAEDAAPNKMCRQAIEDMKREYNHDSSDSMGLDDLNHLCDFSVDGLDFPNTKELRKRAEILNATAQKAEENINLASATDLPTPDECSTLLATLRTLTTAECITVAPTEAPTKLPQYTTQRSTARSTTRKEVTVPSYNKPKMTDDEFYDFYDNVTECYYYDDISHTTSVCLTEVETTTQIAMVKNEQLDSPPLSKMETANQVVLLKNEQDKPETLSKIETVTQAKTIPETQSHQDEVVTQTVLAKYEKTVPESLSEMENAPLGMLPKQFSPKYDTYMVQKWPQNAASPEVIAKYESIKPQVFQNPSNLLAQMLLKQKAYKLANQASTNPEIYVKPNPQMLTKYTFATPQGSTQYKFYPKTRIIPDYDSKIPQMLQGHEKATHQVYPYYENAPKYESFPKKAVEIFQQETTNPLNNVKNEHPYFPLLNPKNVEDMDNTPENKNFFMTTQAALDLAQKIAENTVQKYSKNQQAASLESAKNKIKRSMKSRDLQKMFSNVPYPNDLYPVLYYPTIDWMNSNKPLQGNTLQSHDVSRSQALIPGISASKPNYGFSSLPIIPSWNSDQPIATQSKSFNLPPVQSSSIHTCGFPTVPLFSKIPSTQSIFPHMHLPETYRPVHPTLTQQSIFQNPPANEVVHAGHVTQAQASALPETSLNAENALSLQTVQPSNSQLKLQSSESITGPKLLLQRPDANKKVFPPADAKEETGELDTENLTKLIDEIEEEIMSGSKNNSNSLSNPDPSTKINEYITKNTEDKPESYIALNALYVVNKKGDSKDKEPNNENKFSSTKTMPENAGLKSTVQANGQEIKTKIDPQNTALNIAFTTSDKSGKKQIVEDNFWDFPNYEGPERNENRIRRRGSRKKSHYSQSPNLRKPNMKNLYNKENYVNRLSKISGKIRDKNKLKESEEESFKNLVSQSEQFVTFPPDDDYEPKSQNKKFLRMKEKVGINSFDRIDDENVKDDNDDDSHETEIENKKNSGKSHQSKFGFKIDNIDIDQFEEVEETPKLMNRNLQLKEESLQSSNSIDDDFQENSLEKFKAIKSERDRSRYNGMHPDSLRVGIYLPNPDSSNRKSSKTSSHKHGAYDTAPSRASFGSHNKATSRTTSHFYKKAPSKGSSSYGRYSKVPLRGNSGLYNKASSKGGPSVHRNEPSYSSRGSPGSYKNEPSSLSRGSSGSFKNEPSYPSRERPGSYKNEPSVNSRGSLDSFKNTLLYPSVGRQSSYKKQSSHSSNGNPASYKNDPSYPSGKTSDSYDNDPIYPSRGSPLSYKNDPAYPSNGIPDSNENEPSYLSRGSLGSYDNQPSYRKLASHNRKSWRERFRFRSKEPEKGNYDSDKSLDDYEIPDSSSRGNFGSSKSFSWSDNSDSYKNGPSNENFDSFKSSPSSDSMDSSRGGSWCGTNSGSSQDSPSCDNKGSSQSGSGSGSSYGSSGSYESSQGYGGSTSLGNAPSSENSNSFKSSSSGNSGSYKSSQGFGGSTSFGNAPSCGNSNSFKSSLSSGNSGSYKSSQGFGGSTSFGNAPSCGNFNSFKSSPSSSNSGSRKSSSSCGNSGSYKNSPPYGSSNSYNTQPSWERSYSHNSAPLYSNEHSDSYDSASFSGSTNSNDNSPSKLYTCCDSSGSCGSCCEKSGSSNSASTLESSNSAPCPLCNDCGNSNGSSSPIQDTPIERNSYDAPEYYASPKIVNRYRPLTENKNSQLNPELYGHRNYRKSLRARNASTNLNTQTKISEYEDTDDDFLETKS